VTSIRRDVRDANTISKTPAITDYILQVS